MQYRSDALPGSMQYRHHWRVALLVCVRLRIMGSAGGLNGVDKSLQHARRWLQAGDTACRTRYGWQEQSDRVASGMGAHNRASSRAG